MTDSPKWYVHWVTFEGETLLKNELGVPGSIFPVIPCVGAKIISNDFSGIVINVTYDYTTENDMSGEAVRITLSSVEKK